MKFKILVEFDERENTEFFIVEDYEISSTAIKSWMDLSIVKRVIIERN